MRSRRGVPLLAKTAVAVVSSALAWVIAIEAATEVKSQIWTFGPLHAGSKLWLLIAGAVLTVIAVGIPLVDQYITNVAAVDAATKYKFAIIGVMSPYASLLVGLNNTKPEDPDRESQRGEAKVQILAGLTKLLEGSGRTRSFYLETTAGPPRSLVERGQFLASMADSTLPVLNQDSVDHLLKLLDEGKSWISSDCQNSSENIGSFFIGAPVATPDKVYGLLIVDSSKPGDLKSTDISLVTAFGKLLAAVLSA